VNWAKRFNGVGTNNQQIGAIATGDSSLYSFGWTSQGVEFEGVTPTAGYYLTKHSVGGTQRWVAPIPSSVVIPAQAGFQNAASLIVSPNDEIVIAGHARKVLTFGSGSSTKTLDVDTYVGQSIISLDIPFLARYNKDGTFLDARLLASPGLPYNQDVIVFDMEFDDDANLYIVMRYTDSVVVDRGLASQVGLAAQTKSLSGGYLVCKYDPTLKLKWVRNIAGSNSTMARNISITRQSPTTLAIAGTFEGDLHFKNQSSSTFATIPSYPPGGSRDFGAGTFLASLDTAGNFVWAQRPIDNQHNISDDGRHINDIDADEAGNIYIAGSIGGTAIFGKGTPGEITVPWITGLHYLIAKYNKDGAFQWMKRGIGVGGPTLIGPFVAGRKIACTSAGDCIIGGEFFVTKLSIEGTTVELTPDSQNSAVYQVLYSPEGQYVKAAHLDNSGTGGTVYLGRPTNLLTAIAIKDLQHVYSAGHFFFSMVIAKGFGSAVVLTSDNSSTDLFMASLQFVAPPPVVTAIEEKKNISIFPNPASDWITVENLNQSTKTTITLIDIFGREIESRSGTGRIHVPVDRLAPGVYLLSLVDASGNRHVQRVIVCR